MYRNSGEIAIGTLILICLLVYPINWAIDRVVQAFTPPKVEVVEKLPVCEIDCQVYISKGTMNKDGEIPSIQPYIEQKD